MSAPELTSGICDFETTWVVSTYTSGNELRGPAKHFGEYKSEMEARQALADAGFTDGKWGWRKGYSDAEISKRIKYSNPRADLAPAAPKVKALVEALRWYASQDAWTINQVEGPHGDYGSKARAAIAAWESGDADK